MYKHFFKRVWGILVSPSKSWDSLSLEVEDRRKYLTGYFYPLIVLVALTAFLSPFIKGYEELDVQATLWIGLRLFTVTLAAGILGFFLTALFLNDCFVRWFGMKSNPRKAEMLTAYASTPILIISALTGLLSDFFFMKLLFFYVIVLVWEATTHFYSVEEPKQAKFTALASIAILALPFLVEKLFLMLLPGLK